MLSRTGLFPVDCKTDDFQSTGRVEPDFAGQGSWAVQSGQLVSTFGVDDFPPQGMPVYPAGAWASLPACPHLQDRPVSYPKQHLPLKTLKGLFQQQLSVEMATTITVDSVEKAPSLTTEVLQAVGTWPRRGPRLAELGVPWSGSVAGWAAALSPHLTVGQGPPQQRAPQPRGS